MGVWAKQAKPQIIPHEVGSTFIQHLWFQHVRGKMQIKQIKHLVANEHHLLQEYKL
jgi:hypothetical protein